MKRRKIHQNCIALDLFKKKQKKNSSTILATIVDEFRMFKMMALEQLKKISQFNFGEDGSWCYPTANANVDITGIATAAATGLIEEKEDNEEMKDKEKEGDVDTQIKVIGEQEDDDDDKECSKAITIIEFVLKRKKKKSFAAVTLVIAFYTHTQVATLRILNIGKFHIVRPLQWKLLDGRDNVKRGARHDDDDDNHETQPIFSSIHYQLLQYIGLKRTNVLCAIDYKKQQRRINQSIIGSMTQKSLHYLTNQNKVLDIDNVLVALGSAEWIFGQYFTSAVEPLSHLKEIGV
ncbi:hypothetical protein RFI_22117, partial [Reticulomyxa filosa]